MLLDPVTLETSLVVDSGGTFGVDSVDTRIMTKVYEGRPAYLVQKCHHLMWHINGDDATFEPFPSGELTYR